MRERTYASQSKPSSSRAARATSFPQRRTASARHSHPPPAASPPSASSAARLRSSHRCVSASMSSSVRRGENDTPASAPSEPSESLSASTAAPV